MSLELAVKDLEDNLNKTLTHLHDDYASLQIGRASAAPVRARDGGFIRFIAASESGGQHQRSPMPRLFRFNPGTEVLCRQLRKAFSSPRSDLIPKMMGW